MIQVKPYCIFNCQMQNYQEAVKEAVCKAGEVRAA